MSDNRRKNWFHFGWHPAEEELLLFLDGEASKRQADKVRAHLESCWACRNQRDKLDRAIARFMDYCEVTDVSALSPRASLQFAERLHVVASAQPKPFLIQQWTESLRWQFVERRMTVMATACLLLIAALGLILLRAERPVSAQELLWRTAQAETLSLGRVGEPVMYRKLLVKRVGSNELVVLESWEDAQRKQFRQRVLDNQGLRFLRTNEKGTPAVIAELEQIFRANRFDSQRPLSAVAFTEWRQAIRAKAETVAYSGDELILTTVAEPPYTVNAITEAALADAFAAMAEAWALRRLQERFASQNVAEFDGVSHQRLREIEGNHLSRLRQRSRNLQARLRPLLIRLAGEGLVASPSIEPTRQAQVMAAFRAVEQISRLTDQLIAGDATTSVLQTARALLAGLTHLDVVLAALE